jgi:hypothetical protein
VDVAIEPLDVQLDDYAFADQVLALEGTVKRAQDAGVLKVN